MAPEDENPIPSHQLEFHSSLLSLHVPGDYSCFPDVLG